MRTYPRRDESSRMAAFEIGNAFMHWRSIEKLLQDTEGVSDIQRRPLFRDWDGIHIKFAYLGVRCCVWEPFGDNSRYWIGQFESETPIDLSPLERRFRELELNPIRRLLRWRRSR